MNGEVIGPVVFGTGLAGFASAAVLAMSGRLDDVVVAVVSAETLATAGNALLLGLAVVVAVALASATSRGGGQATSERAVAGHAHGDRQLIARHEAGHVAAARAVGGRVISATASDREGLVRAEVPDVRASITFLRAGRYAAGTRWGCWGDERAERAELRDVPRGERRQLVRDADRDARRIVREHRGQIRRDARTLDRTGQL